MKKWSLIALAVLCLMTSAGAVEIPEELWDNLPEQAEHVMEEVDVSEATAFPDGIASIVRQTAEQIQAVLRQRIRGAVSVLLVVILCGAVEGLYQGTGGRTSTYLSMAGALSVTLLTAGSLDSLIGLGAETIAQLNRFSKALLPTLAAATAASGAATTAAFQQVTTVFLADLLMNLISDLLLPLEYLYIGTLTAAGCMPDNRLGALAEGLKKIITWILTTSLLLFTVYLSVARIISGSVDGAAVRVAKTAISGVVPVVGGILAEAAETVLAGANLLKNTIGVFGMLGILSACVYPFLHIGVQYLLYKLVAFFAGAVGESGLCRLIDGLGGAFGMVLGMTGSCALLMLVSVLSSVAAVTT